MGSSNGMEWPVNNFFIVPIEPIETRYTKHWYEFLPKQFSDNLKYNVVQLELSKEDTVPPENSAGGFFNFTFTAKFKSSQVILIANLFSSGKVKNNDIFFFTDYWNQSVGFLRYMASMSGIEIKIIGIAHAGLWDPADMLTKNFGDKSWGKTTESYLDSCYDYLLFATKFSKDLYEKTHGKSLKNIETGFPMEYYSEVMPNYWELPCPVAKENIVVFPHRKAPEKGYELFRHLALEMPNYKFIVALDECKNKEEYHNLMYRSKVAFSSATQETLGISMGIESLCAGVIPLVPRRLSYEELFAGSSFFYDGSSVESCVDAIEHAMENYQVIFPKVVRQRQLADKWFSGERMYIFLNGIML